MKERAIAIITARGGSKRIPYKNIKEFCGKPIIEYSIRAALESGIFDTVMVSTDDEKIAQIAKRVGAEVPFMRSERTANDFASTADVLREVFDEYGKRNEYFTQACCIYPTAPFVTGEKLKLAMKKLKDAHKDCIMPVVEFSFPPMRGMTVQNDCLEYKWSEYANKRSQDLEKIYHDCGQFYCFMVEQFLEMGNLVTKNTGFIIVDEMEAQDIDNETDWKLAELKYKLFERKVENKE